MKKLMSILFIGCMAIFSACNSSTTTEDTVDSAKDVNDSMMSNDTSNMNPAAPVTEDDANWAVEVANAGMTEVELSKLAQDKATSQRLKDFANMMVTDHTKAGDQLKQLAASKNITLPAGLSDKSQKKLDDLNKKTGADFDKAYRDDMLDDHKDAVDKFQKASNDLKDADLKSFATQTLPTLQMHLDSIKAITGKK
jgi:putative membrane protein